MNENGCIEVAGDSPEMLLLTIGIPTYNGANTIRDTLNSVVDQIDSGVEILISDNGSTDDTANIIREYQSRYSFIRYRHNEENLGADKNFELVARHAKGEFVWLFSDDDLFISTAIIEIIATLTNAETSCGLIVVDCQVKNFVTGQILIDGLNQKKATYRLPASKAIFFDEVTHMIGVASTVLIRRSLIEQMDFSPLWGTSHMHIGIAAKLSTVSDTLVLSRKMFYFRRDGEPRWNNLSYTVKFFFGYERAALFGVEDLQCVDHLIKKKIVQMPKYVLRIKFGNRTLPWRDLFSAVFFEQFQIYKQPIFWAISPFLLLIGLLPSVVFKPIKIMRDRFRETHR